MSTLFTFEQIIKFLLNELVTPEFFFTPFGKEWKGLQATLAHIKIDIQHESWIFISMDVFFPFNIQRFSTQYVLKLWYVPIFSSSWILYCMHLKLKPLSIDLHATTRSNKTSKLQSTYLGHVPLMTCILNHLKSRMLKTPFHILATRLLHFCKVWTLLWFAQSSSIANKSHLQKGNNTKDAHYHWLWNSSHCLHHKANHPINDDQSNIFTSLNYI